MNDLLEYEIYPKLNASLVFGDLTGFKREGKGYRANCPACGDEKRHFYMYDNKPYGFCYKCSHAVNYWNHIKETKNLSQAETFKELARLADVTLSQGQKIDPAEIQKRQEKADTLEIFINTCKKELEKSKEAQNYLKGRGFTLEEALSLDMGYYPAVGVIKTSLTNNTNKALFLPAWEKRIVGLWRNRAGQPITVWGRAIEAKNLHKYYYLYGEPKYSPFGLDECRGNEIIAVEGILDALSLLKSDIPGVTAVGGKHFSAEQIKSLSKARIKTVTLNFDNDPEGLDGTERAINKLEAEGIKTYVIEPSLMTNCKDPDEYIRKNGLAAYNSLLDKAQSGAGWGTQQLLNKYDLLTDKGQREALNALIVYEENIKDPLDSKKVRGIMRETFDIPGGELDSIVQDYHEKKAQERLKQDYNSFFREGLKLLQENRISNLKEYIDEIMPGLRAKAVSRIVAPYGLEGLQSDIIRVRPGLKTGYNKLDEIIRIPQEAITIIAARPSHGKTTFLMNLLINAVKLNPDKTFFFFSYEESRRGIGLKLLNILSKTIIKKTARNTEQLEYYLRGGYTDNNGVERGKAKFKELTESGKLWIIDEPYFVDDLADTLASFSKKYDIGAVFIDYIQKIKIKGKYQTRQIEVQKVSERILEAAKSLSIPIILGAQLGRDKDRSNKLRLDNLREAGDIEQDANLVIGLENKAMEKAQDEGETISGEVELKAIILKNRNGPVNNTVKLLFNTQILTITN